MIKFRFSALVVVMLHAPAAMAWNPFGSKLQAYECKTRYEANACASGCKKVEGVKLEFKVNPEKSLVSQIVFENGKQTSSNSFDNCKVIDANNWSCGEESDTNFSTRKSMQTMANGQFFSWHQSTTYPNKRLGIKGSFYENSFCAK